jgi:hypothetical protein
MRKAYERAVAEEARLWERVGHLGPGRAGAEWQRWLDAVEASRAALDAIGHGLEPHGAARR